MPQYYYLVASLPMLRPEEPPPLASLAFLELCREQASARDHALLARVGFDDPVSRPGDPPAWRDFAAWETALRDELAVQRAQRLGRDAAPFRRQAPFIAGLAAAVKEALAAANPREGELLLDRRRWRRLDDIEPGTGFAAGRLVVYRLKLLLLERQQLWRPGPGREAFRGALARLLEGAASGNGAPPQLGMEI